MSTMEDRAGIVALLKQHQRTRVFCQKSQSRCDRSMDSYITSLWMTYQYDLGNQVALEAAHSTAKLIREQVERKAKYAEKVKLIKTEKAKSLALSKFKDADEKLSPYDNFLRKTELVFFILDAAGSRRPWDVKRELTEKAMRELARSLPIWPWCEGIRGFSDLGLAVLVGEAGDLSNFPTKYKLLKRLSIGCIDGRRQGNPIERNDFIRHGYRPSRRAQIYVFLDENIYKSQKTKEMIHPYARIAEDYKEAIIQKNENLEYADQAADRLKKFPDAKEGERNAWKQGKLSKSHIHRRALRYMSIVFIRDLWKEWHRLDGIIHTSFMDIAA
jgi:hypothetical protein